MALKIFPVLICDIGENIYLPIVGHKVWSQTSSVCILDLHFPGCVILKKLFNLSVLQYPHLEN